MIPEQAIVEWRREAPWSANALVEQDLVISRALVEMYSLPEIAERLHQKAGRPDFRNDMDALLRPGLNWDFDDALRTVLDELVARLPGEPWKGSGQSRGSA